MSVTHTALDGSSVRFDGQLDLSDSPVSVMRARSGSVIHEFTAGHRGLGRWAAREVVGVDLSESYALQGGMLLIGQRSVVGADGSVAPALFGVWEGEDVSVGVSHYGASDSSAMIALYECFDIRELPGQAVTLTPRPASRVSIDEPPTIAKTVDHLGIVEAFAVTRASVRMIPRWSGARVRGGELFKDRVSGADYFVLAGRSAISTIVPRPAADLDDVAAHLSSLAVEWAPAA